MLDRKLIAAALVEAATDLPPSSEGEQAAFAQAVASSLQLEGLDSSRDAVLETVFEPTQAH